MNVQTARARVSAILDRLPPAHRTLLALLLVERLTAAEAAGALGVPASRVESAYRDLLARLGRGLDRRERRVAARARRAA